MKAAIHNLGCKTNAYEAEAMEQALKQAGFSDVQIMKKWGHTFTLLARC